MLTVNNKGLGVVHALNVKAQVKRLQTPLLAMCHGLPRRGDIGFGEEQTSEPDFDVRERIKRSKIVELGKSTSEVRDPLRDGHGLLDLVSPPMGWDRGYKYDI